MKINYSDLIELEKPSRYLGGEYNSKVKEFDVNNSILRHKIFRKNGEFIWTS